VVGKQNSQFWLKYVNFLLSLTGETYKKSLVFQSVNVFKCVGPLFRDRIDTFLRYN